MSDEGSDQPDNPFVYHSYKSANPHFPAPRNRLFCRLTLADVDWCLRERHVGFMTLEYRSGRKEFS
jgi:hypothetical protein